ncbi:MAG: hypothetical protein DMF08_08905, partial [Verrucomicrobia bacterium]
MRPLHQDGATPDSENRNAKTRIVAKIKEHWPIGSLIQVAKIKPSEVDLWLARFRFGAASRNIHIQVVRDVFDLALRHSDYSSFACSTSKVRDKPIRKTPTIEQFNQIIGSIRSQQFNGHNADDSADFPEFIG